MDKILVTGGSGFIGSNYIHYVLEHHPRFFVVNLDKLTYASNKNNLRDLENLPNYQFIHGDICSKEIVDLVVKGCDAVVNFAAESHVDRSIESPDAFIQTNIVGTEVLLDACVKHNKRFHHISTDEVFGSLPLEGNKLFYEDTNYDPSSPYSASKASSDHLVRAYHRTYGLETTITNCSNNYGRFQYPEKLIPKTIIHAIEDKKIPVYGNGKNVRDWVHVEDHCFAIDKVLHEGMIGETYLVGGNAEETNLNIVKAILKLLDKSEDLIEYVEDRKGHDLRYGIDSSKIEKDLSWFRRYNLKSGLKDTVNWYKKNQYWWRKLK
jgi:dTDP-glucose 4,6-dehydratase